MTALLWALGSLTFFILQGVSSQLEFLFPAIGALILSILTALIPGFADLLWLQVLVWGGFSFLSVFWFRKKFRKAFIGKDYKEEKNSFAGSKAKVIEGLSPGNPGRILFGGTSWTAISENETIEVGAEVEILEQEGMAFVVTKDFMTDFPVKKKED